MIVYTSTDDNGFTFQAEIPVDQEPKNLPKDVSIGKTPDGKALEIRPSRLLRQHGQHL